MKSSNQITKKLYESPAKERNNDKYGEEGAECICCGKPMKAGEVPHVHMNESWLAVRPDITEENCEKLTGNKSQGLFPIGNECAKKMAGFTFTSTLDKSHSQVS